MRDVEPVARLNGLKAKLNPWQAGLLFASAMLALPVVVIYASVFWPQIEVWQHLTATVLPDYISTSLLLAFGSGAGAMLIGTLCAWLVSRFYFIGRSYLQWMLLLPLAMPAYIIAYTYTGMLDFAGPVQRGLRQYFNWSYGDYWFPEIRSLGGAIAMLSLVLYPYVFILARTAFQEQPASLREASRSMGLTATEHFFRVALPLARPAIFSGGALVMMEAFADYGTVHYFGLNTFTTGIFRTWFGMGNHVVASQMAALLCSFVFILLFLEQYSRRQVGYHSHAHKHVSRLIKITGWKAVALLLLCCLPLLFGFVLPLLQLLYWAWLTASEQFNQGSYQGFCQLALNSLLLAALAALFIVLLALLFSYAKRLFSSPILRTQVKIAGMGYALPGTVIAVGVMLPLSWFDHSLNHWLEQLFALSPGLLFSGTLFALLLAYTVRFISIALHNCETGMARITASMDQAARSLGASPWQMLCKVHLPMLQTSLISGLLLVFVDVLKELPATLILRPFNFNTLAVRTYELAADERLVDAALPAISIVLVGTLPVLLLTRALTTATDKAE